MQLHFLFCTMLIVISEAFSQKLHRFRRLNGFNRKSSRFQHRLERPARQPKFSDSRIPLRVAAFACESQYEAPDLLLVHHYGVKPYEQEKKCFPRENGANKKRLGRRQCLSDADNSETQTNATNVLASDKEAKTTSGTCLGDKLDAESQKNFSETPNPNSSTPTPTIDTTPVTFNSHKFELTDNPKPYDLSLPENDDLVSNVRKKQEAGETGEESKGSFEESLTESISKLKNMINDLENVVRQTKLKSFVQPMEENYKINNETKVVTEKIITNMTVEDKEIKDKIDKVAIPLLTLISEDLARKNGTNVTLTSVSSSSNATTETQQAKNVRCNPDGTWLSSTMKVSLTLTMQSNLMIKVSVKSDSESQINEKWSLQGMALSSHGGPFIFAGISPQKRVVSFLGQCKMSKEKDFIFGIWTLFSFSPKYTDLWKSVETKLDVLTKNDGVAKKKKKKKKKKERKKKKAGK